MSSAVYSSRVTHRAVMVFPGAHVRLTDATGSDVKVELGTFYDDTMSAEDVQRVLKSTDPVEQPAKCRPMSGS